MTQDIERALEIARAAACAYVWGRQDAGESSRDTGYSMEFGEHYAARKRAYLTGESGYLPNIETCFIEWRDANNTASKGN